VLPRLAEGKHTNRAHGASLRGQGRGLTKRRREPALRSVGRGTSTEQLGEHGLASGTATRAARWSSCPARARVALPPDTYLRARNARGGAEEEGGMKEVWVMKQTVLRARDEQGLQRSLCSFANALRMREGSILDVERTELQPRDRHIAVIRYEIPLPDWAPGLSLRAKRSDET
jgi:hypothetical protein